MKKLIFISLSLLICSPYVLAAEPTKSKAEITNTVMTINSGEITLAKLAQQKATNPEVKKYATQMLNDHTKNNDHMHALAKTEKVSPKETKDSMKLKNTSEQKAEQLKNLEGNEFNRAYMDSQVEMHKNALDKINNELIPNAQDKELRAMLDKTKVKIQEHLKEAEQIRKTL